MYFKVGPVIKDNSFSWIISKNPASKFERELSSGNTRVVRAAFDDNAHYYVGHVVNDVLGFTRLLKEKNLPNYVSCLPSAVCPANLKGFDTTFKSVLRGNNTAKDIISDDEFNRPRQMSAVIGPYACYKVDVATVISLFGSIGITVSTVDVPLFKRLKQKQVSFMLNFSSIEPCTVTEFLQKIYLLSFYISFDLNLYDRIETDQLDKLITLSKTWLDKCWNKEAVINKLCNYDKNKVAKFESNLVTEPEDDGPVIVEPVEPMGLHDLRHNLIVELLKDVDANGQFEVEKPCTVLDIGCAGGKLTDMIAGGKCGHTLASVVGIDVDEFKIRKAKRRSKTNATFVKANILYAPQALLPNDGDIRPIKVILTEVLEHFDTVDRARLVSVASHYINASMIIITVPNVDYNVRFGMAEGEYRHRDHRIEYTKDLLIKEVVNPLSENYDVTWHDIIKSDDGMQPTFVLKAVRRVRSVGVDKKMASIMTRLYESEYLEVSDYSVSMHEISDGMTSRPFVVNHKSIFYMAPTIAPVEFDPECPSYLEHPVACFKYYQRHGVNQLIYERKYMGSRAHVLVFKNPNHAAGLGLNPLTINSRSGFTFFDDKELMQKIYDDIKDKLVHDVTILDCEIMPWSIKAAGLIDREFAAPGQAAYMYRALIGDSDVPRSYSVSNAEAYLHSLDAYAGSGDVEIRPFHVLATASINDDGKFTHVWFGPFASHYDHMRIINGLSGDIFKPCWYRTLNLNNAGERTIAIEDWMDYCGTGGEGFVFKPMAFTTYASNGYIIQPAIKVRGSNYLRIIYGMDYMEKDMMSILARRDVRRKRVLAVQEYELSNKMLHAFLHQNTMMLRKYVAAFMGMEGTANKHIDATL